MKLLLLSVALLGLVGCTSDPAKTKRILDIEGVTDVRLTGYRFFICGDDYTFHSGFIGKKNGQDVSGAVCSGWLKGSQVKYD